MNLLVTGGCGFIGSHFVALQLQRYNDVNVINLDALTYAAHPETLEYLKKLGGDRHAFVHADLGTSDLVAILKEHDVDAVVNFAAESHVDRSILDPDSFVRTNVLGASRLFAAARAAGNPTLVHVSTDEVYGSLAPDDPVSTETSNLDPNSPYAASKASADLLAHACFKTYGQPIVVTRCTNNYGPFQFPEKLLPLVIANALEDKAIPVYGDGKQVRDWIYVEDHCTAVDLALRKGKAGEIYNVSASQEQKNLDTIREVLSLLNKPSSLITYVGDRPAHDRRYGLGATKIRRELGWTPDHAFSEGLAKTVRWYLDNQPWWKSIRDKKYLEYYQANYADKFGGKELSS